MNIQELIKKIEQWAIDRGLDKNGTVEGQLIKTAEEVAELIIGISKDDIDVIKDSIGDVFVTLIVLNLIRFNINFNKLVSDIRRVDKAIPMDYTTNKYDHVEYLVYSLNELLRPSSRIDNKVSFGDVDKFEFYLTQMIMALIFISTDYELKLNRCVLHAYTQIANRKGRVIDGTFIKESDLHG